MILFHGSSVIVENPNLDLSRKSLDFGTGFYTTISKEQAIDFARKIAIRKGGLNTFINVYEFNTEAANQVLDVLRFNNPDREWLDFVHQNRNGIYNGKLYDVVIGPVANDDVFATLIVYEQGILNAEQTLEALKIKQLYSQYVFKTKKALAFLKFKEKIEMGVTS